MTLKPSPMLGNHNHAYIDVDTVSSNLVELYVSNNPSTYSKVLLDKDDVLALIEYLQECYDEMEDYDYN